MLYYYCICYYDIILCIVFAEIQKDMGPRNEDTTNNDNNNGNSANNANDSTQNADGLSSVMNETIKYFIKKYPNKNRNELINILNQNDWDIDTVTFLLDDINHE